jgi:hypothetical protein
MRTSIILATMSLAAGACADEGAIAALPAAERLLEFTLAR